MTGGGAAIAKFVSITAPANNAEIVALLGFDCPADPSTTPGTLQFVNGSGVMVEMSMSAIFDNNTTRMDWLPVGNGGNGGFGNLSQLALIQLQLHPALSQRVATFTIVYRPTATVCELTVQGLNMD